MGLLSVVPLFFCLLAISSVCGQNSLSEADRQELLDAHNRFRSMVDPPATNMRRMVCSFTIYVAFNDLVYIAIAHT